MILVNDSRAEIRSFGGAINAAVQRVIASGWFILGEEVRAFEAEFAAYHNVKHAIGVGSGTEALHLALVAAGIGPGDDVLTVPNTAVATVAAIEAAGGRPVFVDVDARTCLMDPGRLESARTPSTKAIIPVHLHGQVADMDPILAFARRYGLRVIEDSAQSTGARYHGQLAGTMGDLGCYSFYPTKNLAAIGDGGMVVTNDDALADRLRLIRQYGWAERDHSVLPGFNSRLDEIQAAVLRVKLPALAKRNAARRARAERYLAELADTTVTLPVEIEPGRTNWHLFVVRHPERDRLQCWLRDHGIATAIHYPTPIYLQQAYTGLRYPPDACPSSEAAQREILTLPLYPELSADDQERVIAAVRSFT